VFVVACRIGIAFDRRVQRRRSGVAMDEGKRLRRVQPGKRFPDIVRSCDELPVRNRGCGGEWRESVDTVYVQSRAGPFLGRIIGRKPEVDVGRDIEQQLAPQRKVFSGTGAVGVVPVTLRVSSGDARSDPVTNGKIKDTCERQRVVVSVLGADAAFENAYPRRVRNDVYRAAGRIAAIERTLRAFEDLYAINVEERGYCR